MIELIILILFVVIVVKFWKGVLALVILCAFWGGVGLLYLLHLYSLGPFA